MKIFVIKTLIIFISIFVLFKLTIGSLVNSLKKDLSDQLSREKIILVKDKIRDEMKNSLVSLLYFASLIPSLLVGERRKTFLFSKLPKISTSFGCALLGPITKI